MSERTGYPTQKPRALLERIVACATRPGDTVVDLFSGSGTTGEASHVLGRRAILGDLGNVGIATARARLLRAGAGLTIETLQKSTAVHASAKIACRKRGGALEIDLVAPEEPLAWAIGTRASKQSPFVALWHSERAPGTRPSPPARSATIAMPTQGTLFARVYEDDGSIHECAVLPPTRGGS